jgi:hypothetical protein
MWKNFSRRAGGVLLFISGVFFHKIWDWGWELFRAKAGEEIFQRAEHAMHDIPLGAARMRTSS